MIGDQGRAPRKRRVGMWLGLGAAAVAVAFAAGLILAFGRSDDKDTTPYRVTSGSMEPALKKNTTIEVTKRIPEYVPQRGDIVVFTPPADWQAGGHPMVLRVKGEPGDVVSWSPAKGRLIVDGIPLDEPFADNYGGPLPFGPVKVPYGRLWLMGDNRPAAYDSRIVLMHTGDVTKATIPASAVTDILIQ